VKNLKKAENKTETEKEKKPALTKNENDNKLPIEEVYAKLKKAISNTEILTSFFTKIRDSVLKESDLTSQVF
jgi:hypothetical protein